MLRIRLLTAAVVTVIAAAAVFAAVHSGTPSTSVETWSFRVEAEGWLEVTTHYLHEAGPVGVLYKNTVFQRVAPTTVTMVSEGHPAWSVAKLDGRVIAYKVWVDDLFSDGFESGSTGEWNG